MLVGTQIEHEVNGAGVMKLGCGLTAAIAPDADPADVRAVILRMLGDTAMQARALEVAREMAGTRDIRTQKFVAQAVLEAARKA